MFNRKMYSLISVSSMLIMIKKKNDINLGSDVSSKSWKKLLGCISRIDSRHYHFTSIYCLNFVFKLYENQGKFKVIIGPFNVFIASNYH